MIDRSVTSFVAYISILLSLFCLFDFLTFFLFLFLFCRLWQNHAHQRTSRPYAYHQWCHYAEWAEDVQKAEAKSELRSSGGPVLCELDASGNPTSERFLVVAHTSMLAVFFAFAEQYSALLRLSSKDYTIRERLDKVRGFLLCIIISFGVSLVPRLITEALSHNV